MIYLDDRTGKVDLSDQLRTWDLPVEVQRMAYGDVAFLGRGDGGAPVTVGIELKSIEDVCNSIGSGRLGGHQVQGLLQGYQHRWLIVHGIWRESRRTGGIEVPRGRAWKPLYLGPRSFHATQLHAFLTTLETCAGIRVRQARTAYEVARLVETLYRWWTTKSFEEHRSHLTLYLPPDTVSMVEPTFREKVAALLPGIGWKRREAVRDAFPSVRAMVAADEASWKAVPGIGKKLAKQIVQMWDA